MARTYALLKTKLKAVSLFETLVSLSIVLLAFLLFTQVFVLDAKHKNSETLKTHFTSRTEYFETLLSN